MGISFLLMHILIMYQDMMKTSIRNHILFQCENLCVPDFKRCLHKNKTKVLKLLKIKASLKIFKEVPSNKSSLKLLQSEQTPWEIPVIFKLVLLKYELLHSYFSKIVQTFMNNYFKEYLWMDVSSKVLKTNLFDQCRFFL